MPPDLAHFLPTILLAVQRLDARAVTQVLDQDARRLGLDLTVDEVVFPALRIVGTYWAYGSFDVAHEHFFTATLTRWLHARLGHHGSVGGASVRRRGTIVLTAGPQDQHALGLDCLELLLAHRGVEVCNLGAQTPTDAVLTAVTSLQPTAVVVYSHLPANASDALATARALADVDVPIYVAGASFDSLFMRRSIGATVLDGAVASGADLLTDQHTGPVGGLEGISPVPELTA